VLVAVKIGVMKSEPEVAIEVVRLLLEVEEAVEEDLVKINGTKVVDTPIELGSAEGVVVVGLVKTSSALDVVDMTK
jgi:hypothetical protein